MRDADYQGANSTPMPAKTKDSTSLQQAELILHLYELRREAVMRQARSYIGGEFLPRSADEVVAIVTGGGKQGGFILQVYGYWDMVAAFVHHGALSEKLVYDTCQEMYFQYAKIQPYLREFRKKMNLPEWMSGLERLIEGSKAGRKRIATMQQNLAALVQMRAASGSSPSAGTKPGVKGAQSKRRTT